MTIFDDNFWWQFLITIFDDNFWWQFLMTILMTIFDDNLWWQSLMTIFDDNLWWQSLMTIFDDNFWWHFLMTIETIETILKRQSWRLVTFETVLTIENLNSWQSLISDNQLWHWTAFAILAMFWRNLVSEWMLKAAGNNFLRSQTLYSRNARKRLEAE